ncbi:MAG: class I SAM-dependent methyltransferase [Roseburia sp.]|nr:class I SAM-dependent methyltransferase [Roseburia sp.]
MVMDMDDSKQSKQSKQIEEIGKIKLDLTHYPGEDLYCDGEIEDELLDIARNYSQVEYPRIIEERKRWEILYHLSPQRENIVEWLPLDKNMKVLEVGSGCGAVTGVLAEKAGEVTCIDLSRKRSMINAYRHMDCDNVTIHVGNFQDIEPDLPDDYDYICLIGVFEYGQAYIDSDTPYEDFLRIVEKHRKKDGHIVIAIENKLGLKYWAGCKEDHLGTWFEGLEDYPKGGVVRTFTRDGLIKIARKCGFSDISVYYPYPDYKFMTTLYSDKRLPRRGELSLNLRNFDRERLQLFDEKSVFDTLIKEGQFPLFSNSYMVILGEEPPVQYVKYSNDRADEFKIKTLVTSGKDQNAAGETVKTIEKHALSKGAQTHIRNIRHAYEKLCRRFDDGKLMINRCALRQEDDENVCAVLEYLEGRTLEELLDECLERNDMDKFHALFDEYLQAVSYHEDMAVTDYDLIFANILITDDGKWHVIDYEWTFEKQVNTKEIAFRAIYCYLLESEKRNKLNLDFILQRLGIAELDAEQYRQQEMKFQKYVTGKRMSMAEIRDAIAQPVYALANLPLLPPGARWKERVQIYEDVGEGFTEERSYYPEGESLSEEADGKCHLQLSVKGGRKALRIDPCSDYCIVRVEEIKWNDIVLFGEGIKGKTAKSSSKETQIKITDDIYTNGICIGEGVYAFDTEDPNITIILSGLTQQAENLLRVCIQVTRMPGDTIRRITSFGRKRRLF